VFEGKTLFLYYLLVRLLQQKQVVLFSPNSKKLFLFYHNGVYTASMNMLDTGIGILLPNPVSYSLHVFIWLLFDIHKREEPETFLVAYPCLPVQTASPNPI
jgi:hypothetical protein